MIEQLYQNFLESSGVGTDTRKIEPGSMFFALKGPRFNANTFAAEALEKGAKWAVVDEVHPPMTESDARCMLVPDVLTTLQTLATYHRKAVSPVVLGIGGSNGKTTTKELIARVLASSFTTFATPGNLNNHIGVPLSLLQMPKNTQIAVIEMGANHAGEIAQLCEIAQPDFALISNVGKDHLEGFGSVAGVARANAEMYAYVKGLKRRVFWDVREELLGKELDFLGIQERITYPEPGNFLSAQLEAGTFFVKLKLASGLVIESKLFGDYNFANICAALCVGKFFEVPEAAAAEAIQAYAPQNKRSEVIRQNGNTIILDAYNANPSSVKAALEAFARLEDPEKLLILGEMYELGEFEEAEHRAMGELIAQLGIPNLVFFGEATRHALAANPKAYYFTDKFSLHNWLEDRKFRNMSVLVKGSRANALETVLKHL